MAPRIVYIDVDDTLVRSVGTTRIPVPSVVEFIRTAHARGHVLYLWSRGGAEYSRSIADELRLTHCFAAFLPKPELLIDDAAPREWTHCRHVFPLQANAAELDRTPNK